MIVCRDQDPFLIALAFVALISVVPEHRIPQEYSKYRVRCIMSVGILEAKYKGK